MTDVEASSFLSLKTEGNGPVSGQTRFSPRRNLRTVLILDRALKRYGPIKKQPNARPQTHSWNSSTPPGPSGALSRNQHRHCRFSRISDTSEADGRGSRARQM